MRIGSAAGVKIESGGDIRPTLAIVPLVLLLLALSALPARQAAAQEGVLIQTTTPTATPSSTRTPDSALHVGDLDGAAAVRVTGRWSARVTIFVHTAAEAARAGTVVSGVWSGGANRTATCTTNSAGFCIVAASGLLADSVASVTFTVSGLGLAGYDYTPVKNHDPDGDSDGTRITVSRSAARASTPTSPGVPTVSPIATPAIAAPTGGSTPTRRPPATAGPTRLPTSATGAGEETAAATTDHCSLPFQAVGLPPFQFLRSAENQAAVAQAIEQISGRFVLLTIGHSITLEISRSAEKEWLPTVTDRNPQMVMVSGAAAGVTADRWADSGPTKWQVVAERLAQAKATPEQVEVVWLKTALNDRKYDYNARLLGYMEQILINIKAHYPNVKVIYVSPHIRRYTFGARVPSSEPVAYRTGAAVQEFVARHARDTAPAVTYGPYLWSDDPAVWEAADYRSDCFHLSATGESKAGKMVIDWFASDPTAVQWFLREP